MMLSEVIGRKVVCTSTAETIGQIADLVIDPQRRRVVAITLRHAGKADTVAWDDIIAFGADAVTVAEANVAVEASDAVRQLGSDARRLPGKRLLSAAGRELGTLDEIAFDPTTGELTALLATEGELPADRLVDAGSYAVIVTP